MLHERIPLPQGEDVKRMITQIITILRPVVEQAEMVAEYRASRLKQKPSNVST
jgi:hypothetical protein